MKKYMVNGNEINFFIDYIRIPKKYGQEYNRYGYHCDLDIITDKPLSEYEQECLCRLIKQLVNNHDRNYKVIKELGENDEKGRNI